MKLQWFRILTYDIINDAINIFYRLGDVAMTHLHIKINDHISNCFKVVMKNVLISFIKEY